MKAENIEKKEKKKERLNEGFIHSFILSKPSF